MIDESSAKKFCKDDISKIENYDKAINDQTQTWVCHHRLGLTLDGEFAHSKDELKRLGMYLDRPYFELQFLPPSEHKSLHGTNRSDETKRKLSEAKKGEKHPMYGKTHSDETKMKMSEAQTLRYKDPEQRKKLSESLKGKPHSDETRRKISEAMKGKPSPRKGKPHGPMSAEQKQKISEAMKGKTLSDETRRKIAAARKGKTISAEQKQKIAEAMKGKTLSAETRRKISEARKAYLARRKANA